MRGLIVFALAFCSVAYGQVGEDFTGKPKEFERHVANMQRLTMAQVGVIETPLPDREGFRVPGRWIPVKLHPNKETHPDGDFVYLVKDGFNFLKPNPRDSSNSTYVLWATTRGKMPEIILYPCPPKRVRQAFVNALHQQRAERQAEAERRRMQSRKDRERRDNERRARASARQETRQRRFNSPSRRYAASAAHHQQLMGMQQPLADAVIDRVRSIIDGQPDEDGKVVAFSTRKVEATAEIRRNIMAVMAIQMQMRDLAWCDAIEKHLAPDMWSRVGRPDTLKGSTPDVVIPWLTREVERQVQIAEEMVQGQALNRENEEIMHLEAGMDPPPRIGLDKGDGPPRIGLDKPRQRP